MEKMKFKEKLVAIQNELKAPKSKRNTFGNYNYRSCEDILEAAKPLLQKHGVSMTISDTVEHIGDRYYIKATVYLEDTDGDGYYSVSAYAREEDDKKGLSPAQITGSSSSYARKYALNGAFLIDDTKDPDTDEYATEYAGRAGARERYPETPEKTKKGQFCEVCGKFIPDNIAERSKAANNGHIYCSGTCRDKAKGAKKDAK